MEKNATVKNETVSCTTANTITELEHEISNTTDMINDLAKQTSSTIDNHKQAIEKLSKNMQEYAELAGKVFEKEESRIKELENKLNTYRGLLIVYAVAIIALLIVIICLVRGWM